MLAGGTEVDFLVNDLSFHAQFLDLASFKTAIERLMTIRVTAGRFGWALHCHRNIVQVSVTPTMTMPQAVQVLNVDERRALLQWLTKRGPFWDDARNHGSDDWLESNGNIVTDTAVGEAGWCCLNGIERGLVSLMPSNWQSSPVPVDWVQGMDSRKSVSVANHWDPVIFESVLQAAPVPLVSWVQLEAVATGRFDRLTFAVEAFRPLNGYPFVSAGAQRVLFLLSTLNRFKACFSIDGQRTSEGHKIYQDFFTGQTGGGGHGAPFSDSSPEEKIKFERELRFKHPIDPSSNISCPWHGKVQTPPLRIHFSWPIRANDPLFIVYVGPKITKR